MIKNYNNEENKFQEVTNQLKELPLVTAPPDFEMNLRRKINQLGYEKDKKPVYKPSIIRSLVPISAIAVCAVVVFVLFKGKQSSDIENPFKTAPALRTEISNTIPETDNKKLLINPRNVTSNDVVIESQVNTANPRVQQERKLDNSSIAAKKESDADNENIVSSGAASKSRTKPFYFNDGYENDVDQSLRARPDQYPSSSPGMDPRGDYYENGHNVNFGGFNIIQGNDRDIIELRAKMDSIKKWMRENR